LFAAVWSFQKSDAAMRSSPTRIWPINLGRSKKPPKVGDLLVEFFYFPG
jgi:hypothetical protein